MPAGSAYPSGHLVPSPILGLANAPIVETKFLELAMSLLDFSPRIPLGTFSILLGSVYITTLSVSKVSSIYISDSVKRLSSVRLDLDNFNERYDGLFFFYIWAVSCKEGSYGIFNQNVYFSIFSM